MNYMELTYIIFNLQCLGLFVSFVYSIRIMYSKIEPSYMRGFYWYSVVGIISTIPVFIEYNFLGVKYSPYILNLSLLFHFPFLSLFLAKVISPLNTTFRQNFWFIFLLCTGVLIFLLFTNDLSKANNKAFAFANFCLVIFCIFYFYSLFRNIPKMNLLLEPSFWIITGIFICMSISVPVSAVADYLINNNQIQYFKYFYSLISVSYLSMHIFFIKSYLCCNPQQRI